MENWLRIVALCALISVVFGSLGALAVQGLLPKSNNDLIREFYSAETAVSVSPSDYVSDLKAGKSDGLLVDLRSAGEYRAGHLVTAINVPAGGMDSAQLVAAFSRLPKGQTPITYCYSSYCMLSREVGHALADNGIYVKHLTAGWYEIKRDFSQYVVNGTAPGNLIPDANYTAGACDPARGEFGC